MLDHGCDTFVHRADGFIHLAGTDDFAVLCFEDKVGRSIFGGEAFKLSISIGCIIYYLLFIIDSIPFLAPCFWLYDWPVRMIWLLFAFKQMRYFPDCSDLDNSKGIVLLFFCLNQTLF
jgi:hypothetical protein